MASGHVYGLSEGTAVRKFQFRLQSVLKYRITLEELRRHAFALVQSELIACDSRIAALRAECARTLAGRHSLDIWDIEQRERYIDTLNASIEREQRVREGILARLEDARCALIAAKQAREALERIRQSDFEEFVQQEGRKEHALLDEMATLRHTRRERRI
jgi:flagellar FliJ protein